jgi:hypothetical protein
MSTTFGSSTDRTTTSDRVRTLGLVCFVAGVLGALCGLLLAVWPEQVPDDRWSYPMTPGGFTAIQLFFAVHHLGLVAGLVALGASGVLGTGRLGRIGLWLSIGGMALLALTEALAVSAADKELGEAAWLDSLYGVSTTACGIGLVLAGIAVLREGRWAGWPSYLVLVLGIWVFVPMFPALVLSFLGARLAIGAWMVLFGVLGWLLWRQPAD